MNISGVSSLDSIYSISNLPDIQADKPIRSTQTESQSATTISELDQSDIQILSDNYADLSNLALLFDQGSNAIAQTPSAVQRYLESISPVSAYNLTPIDTSQKFEPIEVSSPISDLTQYTYTESRFDGYA